MPGARVLVLLSALCFGTTGTAQALGPHAAPAAVGAARVVVGGLLLVLIARRLAPRAAAAWPARAVLAGAAAVAGYQLTFFAAVHETGSRSGRSSRSAPDRSARASSAGSSAASH